VTSRGDRREAIFLGEEDRVDWLNLLGKVCDRCNWRCHAYCEMTNHYHVVVETADANLSKGMRQLNGVYTQRFNRRHALDGHLFQGRFKAILVERDEYLLELSRYVVLNPVRAKAAAHASVWEWSSYGATVGSVPAPAWLEVDWIIGQFGTDRLQAQQRYADFVDAGVSGASVWEHLRHQIFLGSDRFIQRFSDKQMPLEHLREVPRAQRRPLARPLEWFELTYPARKEAVARAFLSGGYTMQEIAGHFGVHYSTVSRAVRSLEERRNLQAGGSGVIPHHKNK